MDGALPSCSLFVSVVVLLGLLQPAVMLVAIVLQAISLPVDRRRALRGLRRLAGGRHGVARGGTCAVPSAARLHGCMAAWLHGCMAAWLHGCMAAWLYGCTAARLHGCTAA